MIAVIVLYRCLLVAQLCVFIITECYKLLPIVLWISCSVAIDDIGYHANKNLEKQ